MVGSGPDLKSGTAGPESGPEPEIEFRYAPLHISVFVDEASFQHYVLDIPFLRVTALPEQF